MATTDDPGVVTYVCTVMSISLRRRLCSKLKLGAINPYRWHWLAAQRLVRGDETLIASIQQTWSFDDVPYVLYLSMRTNIRITRIYLGVA
jgi:hypothetical protein